MEMLKSSGCLGRVLERNSVRGAVSLALRMFILNKPVPQMAGLVTHEQD